MSDTIAVLIFGGVVISAETAVMIFRGRGWGIQSTRLVGLSLVVVATMFLAAGSLSPERLGAAFAVLGVVAGYLVGVQGPKKSATGEPSED
jgi:hypothetical protein